MFGLLHVPSVLTSLRTAPCIVLPHAPCSLPYALCPMLYALCPMPLYPVLLCLLPFEFLQSFPFILFPAKLFSLSSRCII
ncbi:hypothetical protein EYV94_05165 [Puteibacter caeruleilacunae]|nr:hypothetical protein EYV94_05165 [Puteibacter caeruleilacunae]